MNGNWEFKRRNVEIDEDLREWKLKLEQADRDALRQIERRFGAEIPPHRLAEAHRHPVRFECHRHYLEHLRREGILPQATEQVLGDYHPASQEIYVDAEQRGLLKTLVHERLHQMSDNRFRALLGQNLDEGMTEYLAEQAVGGGGGEVEAWNSLPEQARVYPRQKRLMEQLAARFGDDVLKRAYFRGDWQGLRARVNRELGDGALEQLVHYAETGQYDQFEAWIRRGL